MLKTTRSNNRQEQPSQPAMALKTLHGLLSVSGLAALCACGGLDYDPECSIIETPWPIAWSYDESCVCLRPEGGGGVSCDPFAEDPDCFCSTSGSLVTGSTYAPTPNYRYVHIHHISAADAFHIEAVYALSEQGLLTLGQLLDHAPEQRGTVHDDTIVDFYPTGRELTSGDTIIVRCPDPCTADPPVRLSLSEEREQTGIPAIQTAPGRFRVP